MSRVTAGDDALVEAAKSLTPDKSLERVDSHAKYLFTLVGTVGTLLTGFSLFSTNHAFTRDPGSLRLPLAFVCGSLALAMLALTPWPGRVDPDNLAEVRTFMNSRLRLRGLAVFLAGLCFAGALLSASFVGGRPATPVGAATDGSTTFTVTRGDKGDDVKASIKVKALPANTEVKLEADAVLAGGSTRTLLERQTTLLHGGEVAFDVNVPAIAGTQEVRFVTTAKANDRVVYSDSAVVAIEPRVVAAPVIPAKPAKKR